MTPEKPQATDTYSPMTAESRQTLATVAMAIVGGACFCTLQVTTQSTEISGIAALGAAYIVGTRIMGPTIPSSDRPEKRWISPKEATDKTRPLRWALILAASTVATICVNPAIGSGTALATWYFTRRRKR